MGYLHRPRAQPYAQRVRAQTLEENCRRTPHAVAKPAERAASRRLSRDALCFGLDGQIGNRQRDKSAAVEALLVRGSSKLRRERLDAALRPGNNVHSRSTYDETLGESAAHSADACNQNSRHSKSTCRCTRGFPRYFSGSPATTTGA